MNHVSWCAKTNEFYVTAVRRKASGPGYVARGKRVSRSGRLVQVCQGFEFADLRGAERKAKDLARTKRRRGHDEIADFAVPDCVRKHFEVSADMQVTFEELAVLLDEAKREVYVVLVDVTGVEAFFDAGVEYVGRLEDDKDYLGVHDRFGELRGCYVERVASVRPTERAQEAFDTAGRMGR